MSIERVGEHGIVGAGGGGFPTAVKLATKASVFLVNAAECEPLLHKDKELLAHEAEPMLRGLRLAMGRPASVFFPSRTPTPPATSSSSSTTSPVA
jgi:Na+-translocating ferredoxin:NAD+ oxidoreductase RnfC subunit